MRGTGAHTRDLARVAATRFTIEQCLLEAKDDGGTDPYEVRS